MKQWLHLWETIPPLCRAVQSRDCGAAPASEECRHRLPTSVIHPPRSRSSSSQGLG